MAGMGPTPFCGMLLADFGAEVISVSRNFNTSGDAAAIVSERGKRSIVLDLKDPKGKAELLVLCESSDAIIEGFRPGVMERLGIGPEECLCRNPRLVFGRMTGWGQTGPLASHAGHDINYIALSGALHTIGVSGEKPTVPLNMVGDFGGGGMLLALSVVSAILNAKATGQGQVVDASMVEGSALLMHSAYAFYHGGLWNDQRGSNLLDGGAHFYDTYETKDGKYVAIGAIEPQFYRELLRTLGVDISLDEQMHPSSWPISKARIASRVLTKSRGEWEEIFAHSDACFSPILSLKEAPEHVQNKERGSFIEIDGIIQPAPAPKFSVTPLDVPRPPPKKGEHMKLYDIP